MNGTGGNMGTQASRLEAVTHLARTLSAPMTPLQRMEGLQVVNARLARKQRGRVAGLVLSILGLSAAVAGGLLLVRSPASKVVGESTLAYRVEGGEIGDGGYIRSRGPAGTLLRFGEGTELRLMSGARGRLSAVDARGARLAIEEGQAEVKVTPRPGARWLVDAGPFLITVRGTVFTAAWDGAKERLDIHMTKGLVSVTGPLADGVMAVKAGQHLSVNVRSKEVSLRQIDETDELDRAPATGPGLVPGPALAATARATGARASALHGGPHASGNRSRLLALVSEPRSWAMALAVGDLDSILRDAERRGLQRAVDEASSEDLAALADAARYRRRNDVARMALLAERERFPGSTRATDSAFLLGRLEENRSRGVSSALEWYDLYLKEAPSGAYSSEALGRKMTATERAQGAPAAREIAEEYLRRFPNGTYAGAARALREGP